MSEIFGYIHTRGKDKHDNEIHDRFLSLRVRKEDCFIDVDDRKCFKKMKELLNNGDLVVMDRIMSLGENDYDIMKRWYELRETGANVLVLDVPNMDTRTSCMTLGDVHLTDLIMETMKEITIQTSQNRKEKQMSGIKEAKKKGVRFGRVMGDLPEEFYHYAELYRAGKITIRMAADKLDMSPSTFSYRLHSIEKERIRKED